MSALPPARRSRALTLALALLALGAPLLGADLTSAAVAAEEQVVTTQDSVGAEAAPAPPRVDGGHPFSDPVFLPVRDPVYMDCYASNQTRDQQGNPFCPRRDWQLNLLAQEFDANFGVYAMGAGRLKVIEARGPECGKGKGFGTYVQIDHGGGVYSGYTHLNNGDRRFMALDGQLVTAGQRIGTMGTTGAPNKNNSPTLCRRHYLDFFVFRIPGPKRFEMKTLTACRDGEATQWPAEMYPQHPTWNQLPKWIDYRVNTELPAPGREDELPDNSCLPSGAPQTLNQPRAASLSLGGSNRLVARWLKPPAGTRRTMVQVQVKRPQGWNTEGFASVPGDRGSVILREANAVKNYRRIRVMVSHHNGVGWSKWSNASNERLVGAPPAPPRQRVLKVFRTSRAAGVQLGWSQGRRIVYPPTGWVVEIREGTTGRWRPKALPYRTWGHRWSNVRRGTTYYVRVKARSGAGFSGYLTRRVRTPR